CSTRITGVLRTLPLRAPRLVMITTGRPVSRSVVPCVPPEPSYSSTWSRTHACGLGSYSSSALMALVNTSARCLGQPGRVVPAARSGGGPVAAGGAPWSAAVGVRSDEPVGGGQPERGEQDAGRDVGGVVLAPVHAGGRDEDRHADGRDQEQPSPPATGVAGDQDRDRDVEAAGGGLVPGREGRGRQGEIGGRA